MNRLRLPAVLIACPVACAASTAHAMDGSAADWLPWLVLGGIALFVAGVLVRMFLAARFPRGYRQWAERRRDKFAARNDAWDREDEDQRR